jgi:hypothetical protein
MSLEDHKSSSTCGVSTPHVSMSAILLLMTIGNNKVKKWPVLVWHKMHIKLHEIPQITVILK